MAKKVLEDGDIHQGAIVSLNVAKQYNLDVLAEKINDSNINSTRFIIISNKKEFLKNANKISVCFELPRKWKPMIYSHIFLTTI